jgi:hypothetical protein
MSGVSGGHFYEKRGMGEGGGVDADVYMFFNIQYIQWAQKVYSAFQKYRKIFFFISPEFNVKEGVI